jgi:hypothetical protein
MLKGIILFYKSKEPAHTKVLKSGLDCFNPIKWTLFSLILVALFSRVFKSEDDGVSYGFRKPLLFILLKNSGVTPI